VTSESGLIALGGRIAHPERGAVAFSRGSRVAMGVEHQFSKALIERASVSTPIMDAVNP
jgi:hypothetical protein